MEPVSPNMRIWAQCADVPEWAQKPITGGRLKGMTDISPQWRYKILTKMFGPRGFGWNSRVINRWMETAPDGEIKAFVEIEFWYKDPETGEKSDIITASGGSSFYTQERSGWYCSDECYKMAETDAMSVACKSIGVAAKIYGSGDRTKYVLSEEGELCEYQPTDEEIKAENRAKKAAQMENVLPGVAAKTPTTAPAQEKAPEKEAPKAAAKLPLRSEIQKRLCHIRDHEDCQELKDLASKNQWGTAFGKWSDKEIFDAYNALSAMGVDI